MRFPAAAHLLMVGLLLVLADRAPAKERAEQRSRGFLTTPAELRDIARKAADGLEPHRTNVADFMQFIGDPAHWPYGEITGPVQIRGGSASQPPHLSAEAARLVYGKSIAFHITGDERFAASARERILDLIDSTYTHGLSWTDNNQAILNLARGGTPYIYAADLLEGWDGWSPQDKHQYQQWLAKEVYPLVSWASRVRKNNWGVAGSLAAAAIADYLHDTQLLLEEVEPVKTQLSPAEAFRLHNRLQIGRQSTAVEWKMDAKTPSHSGKNLWGILPTGGIPEEIRRGKNPVDAPAFADVDSGTSYTQSYIEHLTAHAELLRRRGDCSIYDLAFHDGSGSLLQAYLYVVDNPHGSHPFTRDRLNAMYIAYRYYRHPSLRKSIEAHGPADITGQRLALFGRLTHALDASRAHCSGPPPVAPPPGGFTWPMVAPVD